MSRELHSYIDRVVDASMAPAAKAMAPVLRDVRKALDDTDGYEAADAALRRLERGLRTGRRNRDEGLEPVLIGAMMNGTSVGGVEG